MQSTVGPLVVERAVDQELCRELLSSFAAQYPAPRSYQGAIDHNVRNCEYVKVPEHVAETVNARISGYMERYYNAIASPIPGQPTLIYRYMKGVGFDVHHDEVTDIEISRARQNGQPVIGGNVTALLFLNDPDQYVGGELYFKHPVELEVRPPSGTLVSFPATRDYLHGVRPIHAGERYTLLVRYMADVQNR